MSICHSLNHFAKIAAIIWLLAIAQSVLAFYGIFSINQTAYQRVAFGLIELVTMGLVIMNSVAILRFVNEQESPLARMVSQACLCSLILCFLGDIVNRNFFQEFYQYGDVVKHSYLADSVLLFFPGYSIIIAMIAAIAFKRGVTKRFIGITALLASVIALCTYFDMHITNTDTTLTLITMSYSILVSILAISAIWLLKAFAWRQAPLRVWLAALGVLLAMIADAIIGQFWIFGNQGQGYFPIVSHINWIVYVASQLLIQQLPLGLLQLKECET